MAKRSVSPFSERDVITNPDNFFGREAEIEAVFAVLDSGKSAVIHGESKVGKSSFLQQILCLGKEKGLDIQYLDFKDVEDVSGMLASEVSDNQIFFLDHIENIDEFVLDRLNLTQCVIATRNFDLNLTDSQTIILNNFTPEEARAYVLQPALPPLDQRAFDHLTSWVDGDYHPLKVTIAADLLWNNSPRPAYQTVHLAYAQSVKYYLQDNKPALNTTPRRPKRSLLKRILGIG